MNKIYFLFQCVIDIKLINKKCFCTCTDSTRKREKIPAIILFFAAVKKVKEKHFTFTHHIISCMNFSKRRKDMSPEELAEVRAYGRQKSAEFRQRQKEKQAAEEAAAAEASADAQAAAASGTENEADKVNQEALIDKEGIEKEAAAENALKIPKQNKQQKPTPEENRSGKSFRCSCGADIFPDYDGNYPDFCSSCGSENDYRGIAFFENSRQYLVCENCGKVSKVRPGMVKCPKCGYGGA